MVGQIFLVKIKGPHKILFPSKGCFYQANKFIIIKQKITSITNADINLAKLRMILDPLKHVSDILILVEIALNAKKLSS